jgi:site-specific DNA-adenine methylase
MELPIIAYPGAKGRMAKELIAFMPETGRYFIDLFAGRGNVAFSLMAMHPERFERWWLNDIQTAGFFEKTRTHGSLIRVPEGLRDMRLQYSRFLARKRANRVPTIASILLEPYLSPRGGYGKGGPATQIAVLAETYRERLRLRQRLMRNNSVKITAKDWKALPLDRLTADDFVFLDPPYYECDVRAYKSWPLEEHLKMVDMLKRARFKWMLTEYRQGFYVDAFGEPFHTKNVANLASANGSRRTECVWKGNF